jgi:hypothetical protein
MVAPAPHEPRKVQTPVISVWWAMCETIWKVAEGYGENSRIRQRLQQAEETHSQEASEAG